MKGRNRLARHIAIPPHRPQASRPALHRAAQDIAQYTAGKTIHPRARFPIAPELPRVGAPGR